MTSGNGGQSFHVACDDGNGLSKIELYDQENNESFTVNIDSNEGKCSVYGVAGGGPNFTLLADDKNGESTLVLYDGTAATSTLSTSALYIDDGSSNSVNLESSALTLNDNGGTGTYEPAQITISDGSNNVYINIPGDDATWQEISVCVDGDIKTMKVLGTEPA